MSAKKKPARKKAPTKKSAAKKAVIKKPAVKKAAISSYVKTPPVPEDSAILPPPRKPRPVRPAYEPRWPGAESILFRMQDAGALRKFQVRHQRAVQLQIVPGKVNDSFFKYHGQMFSHLPMHNCTPIQAQVVYSPKGGRTHATAVVNADGAVRRVTVVARCSDEDAFCRRDGRLRALDLLLDELTSGLPEAEALIKKLRAASVA